MASGQTGPRTDLAVSYRFLSVTTSDATPSNVQALTGAPLGFEVTLSARVRPVLSVLGQFGTNWTSVAVPTGGTEGLENPSLSGTEFYRVFDLLGGVKFSRPGTSAFFQVLAGSSVASVTYKNVSEAGMGQYQFDEARGKHFAIQPGVGVDVKSATSRVGVRVQLGWELAFAFDAAAKHSSHLEFATGVVIALGKR